MNEKPPSLDPDRVAYYQNLKRQLNLILSKVHFDGRGKLEDSFKQEETTFKKKGLHALAYENMDMSAQPCKSKRQHQFSEEI